MFLGFAFLNFITSSNWLAFRRIGAKRSVHGQNRFFIRFFVTFLSPKKVSPQKVRVEAD